MLQLNLAVKELNPNVIVVHCSAGVGRTGNYADVILVYKSVLFVLNPGTFITTLKITDQVDKGDEAIDIFNTVLDLRKDRRFMVQKPEQYCFLYKALASYLSLIPSTVLKDNAQAGDQDEEVDYVVLPETPRHQQ